MPSGTGRPLAGLLSPDNLRHYGGFVLAAVCSFITDAGLLELLTTYAGMSPFLARPIGISCAIVVGWLVNRTVTFAMTTPPQLSELARFAAVSWIAQTVNYAVFAALLLTWPGITPFTALVFACFVSMFVSYVGYRFGVFHKG